MPTLLVTGAGKGLGYEFARQYAAEGWDVLALVRDPVECEQLEALGPNVRASSADVTDRTSLAKVAAAHANVPIDLLICNAGIFGPKGWQFGQTDYDVWARVMQVNVLGSMATIEAFAGNVALSGRKQIAVMSSRLGSIAYNDGGEIIYRSSKAALNQVVKTLSVELAPRGISVVALSPGRVHTDMGGPEAPLSPEFSISSLRRVIAALRPDDTGKFIAFDGQENAW